MLEMSLLEMLQMTEKDLKSIDVPIEYAEQIARPLYVVLTNIRSAITAMQEAEAKKEAKEENVQS